MRLYTEDKLDGAIAGLKRDSDKLQNKVHALLISTLFVWTKAGKQRAPEVASDTARRLTDIQANSPWHGQSVMKWIAAKVPGITWNEEADCYMPTGDNDCRLLTDTFKAIRDGEAFYQFSPAPKPKPMDNHKTLMQWIENSRKRASKPKHVDDAIDLTLVNLVVEALKAREAEQAAA